MAEQIDYRGYKITAESYQDDETGKWVPRAVIESLGIGSGEVPLDQMPMSWEQEFDTARQAEDYALDGAKFYIDSYF